MGRPCWRSYVLGDLSTVLRVVKKQIRD